MNPDHALTAVLITIGVTILVAIQAFRERKEKKAAHPIVATVAAVGLIFASALFFGLLLMLP